MIPKGDMDLATYLNEVRRTNNPDVQNNTFWFATPKKLGKKRIILQFRHAKDDAESRMRLLERFHWTDTLLIDIEKQAVENILVDYHDVFARHRMDFGINRDFKVKLTTKDDRAVYNRNLPMPFHLKEDLIFEFTHLHNYGIITVLPFSKFARPIFAHRRPNGNLPLAVNLRKINTLVADDYTNKNDRVNTLSDDPARKSLFCKLDSSQAYQCLQMADQRSVEKLALNYANRPFSHKRLAQGLSRSVSAFSSFM